MVKEKYLAGKVAIVTGSSKLNGIGAATAFALAEHGANVTTPEQNPSAACLLLILYASRS
jgi:NAD(P)-dependent dehydrogenase (short-subunit alcohol dehydrogenase family)